METGHGRQCEETMRVGVPKEIKAQESRVGLTPMAVREFVAAGHEVLVERGAGAGINAGDDAYADAGARVLPAAADVYGAADLVVKVKEPLAPEWPLLRARQIVFTYLHLAAAPDVTRAMLDAKCIGVAYETVTDAHGGLPLLAPMSEVAGRLAIEAAAHALRKPAGGKGRLLGGVPGVRAARVVVVGAGTVGTQAARMAAGLGAEVTVLDRSIPRLRWIDEHFRGRVRTRYSMPGTIEEEVVSADVVIGAVLVAGAAAPKLVTRAMLRTMERGSVLVDVSIDQGGCFETSRPTTHEAPTFVEEGIVHYCVANMPGAVPMTSTYALVNATLPFGLALAAHGRDALARDPHLRAGLSVHFGQLTSAPVAAALGLPFTDPAALFESAPAFYTSPG
jgi:alanine dehydrogenase